MREARNIPLDSRRVYLSPILGRKLNKLSKQAKKALDDAVLDILNDPNSGGRLSCCRFPYFKSSGCGLFEPDFPAFAVGLDVAPIDDAGCVALDLLFG
ncbi:MAG: hypothetical protein ACI8ZW_002061 [Yoonia sp.]|jgi:hypothetical protein